MGGFKNFTTAILMGAALAAFFSGGGNLNSQAALGMLTGREWDSAFLGYAVPGLGLPFLIFLAAARRGGKEEEFASEMGGFFSVLFASAVTLCAGVLSGLPGTAAAFHELVTVPLFGAAPRIFTGRVFFEFFTFFAFFVSVFLIVSSKNSPAAAAKIAGKILAPVFLIIMCAAITMGILSPADIPADMGEPRLAAFRAGLLGGYQSLDIFRGFVFSGTICAALPKRADGKIGKGALFVCASGALLTFSAVQTGLLYIGAAASGFSLSASMRGGELLPFLFGEIFGSKTGVLLLACASSAVCLAAAVGLTAGAADFFSRVTKGKFSYKTCAAVICAAGFSLAALNAEAPPRFAASVLVFLYPAAIVMTLLNAFRCRAVNKGAYVGAVCGALAASALGLIPVAGVREGAALYAHTALEILPFAAHGFTWIIPSAACGVIGALYGLCRKKMLN